MSEKLSNAIRLFLIEDESGATAIEYAMIAAGVAMVIVGAVNAVGVAVLADWQAAANAF